MSILMWIGICIMILSLLTFLFFITGEEDGWHIILLINIIIAFLWGYHAGLDNGHKEGQVDALNGEYQYEMKVETEQDTTYIEVN